MFASLTVEETLMYTARLRLPGIVTHRRSCLHVCAPKVSSCLWLASLSCCQAPSQCSSAASASER
jgi:hypothetical protein